MTLQKFLAKKMIFTVIIIFLIIILLGAIIYLKINSKVDYTSTAYEKEVIEYFKEIALESEYYDSPERTTKWKKSMVLYVIKDKPYEKQMKAIQKTIDHINILATDGFKIELTENPKKCNSLLYLLIREGVAKMAPNFYKSFTDNIDVDVSGFAYTEFDWSNYKINKAFIFIDPEESIEVQESTILEEITQSIGLMNDSEKYPESIFYENQIEEDSINMKYSSLDEDVIKLLYHPRMKSGLNSKQVENVIKRILKNKEIELSGN